MTNLAVAVRGLGKRYQIGHERAAYGRLTESLTHAIRSPIDRLRGKSRPDTESIWALKDITFDVEHGDVVGFIGRNGAGKSTLLRILSRITEPSIGEARIFGRVGSLLEVGTGFHPELTGRENIRMSAAVLGMRREEIARRFDEIVAFAEVDQFLDTPVKRYSSGMQVRLGFAVAAHLATEILIVDEVLAVGDTEFQRKCLSKMGDVSRQGRTVLFVSHNMAAVEALCRTGILLEHGSIAASGLARDVVDRYLSGTAVLAHSNIADRTDRQGDGRFRVVGIDAVFRTGSPASLRLRYVAKPDIRRMAISVGLFTARGEGALYLANEISGDELADLPATGELVCKIDQCGLLPGTYSLNVYAEANGALADWVTDAAIVEVAEGDLFGTGRLPPLGYGPVAVQHRWHLES